MHVITFIAVTSALIPTVFSFNLFNKRDQSCTARQIQGKNNYGTTWTTTTVQRVNSIYVTSTPTFYFTPTVTTTSYWDYATLVYGAVATSTTGTVSTDATVTGTSTITLITVSVVVQPTTITAASPVSTTVSSDITQPSSGGLTSNSSTITMSTVSNATSVQGHAVVTNAAFATPVSPHIQAVWTFCTSTMYNTQYPTTTVVAPVVTVTMPAYTVSVNTYGVSTLTHTTDVAARVTATHTTIVNATAGATSLTTTFNTVTIPWSAPKSTITKAPVLSTSCLTIRAFHYTRCTTVTVS